MNTSARAELKQANEELLELIDHLEEISEDNDDYRVKLNQIIETLVCVSEQLDELN